MNKQEFLGLVWRLEEILVHVDHLRSQIGNCGKPCEGLDAIDDDGLCLECCDTFARVLAEEERLAEDKEYNEVMRKLKEACDDDKSGVYQRVLKQSREGRLFISKMDKLICYCFNYFEAEIEQDVIKNNGRSPISEEIKASKKEGICRCHETNPTGK
ncbi:MAG: hypothetical protein ABSA46_15875 [Thermodesulfovibrionales bacterium]|jgi:hypothetical protein